MQSARLINAVMNSVWYVYAVQLRKELSILLARAIQPVFFTAGRMFRISIGTLLAVICLFHTFNARFLI